MSKKRYHMVQSVSNLVRCLTVQPFLGILVCLMLSLGLANAQVTGLASLSGTVTDPTGAVIVGAQVVVTNTETQVTHRSATNPTGYFEVNDLITGPYSVTVTYPGFEKLMRNGITLRADAHVNVPLHLRLGSDATTVVVNGDASLLNRDSGTNGQVLTHHEMDAEPVNSSNTMQFIEIAPGVQSQFSQTYSMGSTLGWNGVSKMGTAGLLGANEYSLDGAPNVGNTRGNAISLSSDEIGEMKIDVSGFDAAVGHTLGINVTQTIQNGTNNLHGSVRAIYVNKHWAAMQHFQGLTYRHQEAIDGCTNGPSTSAQCLSDEYRYGLPGTHEHNDGFGIGGPVFIPKIYDGRKKFFWFTGYDNNLYQDTSVNSDTIPTAAERGGDFSALPTTTSNIPTAFTSACGTGTAYYGQYQIYNPYTVKLDSNGVPRRTPVCGNVLPGCDRYAPLDLRSV
ncbi:MAG: carboxypeptidase-like regulatory domain-containing protein [Terracidiphilus sp.]|nr:carboxypeptidase-like regulatory domain-containing protein [Terracidiphilus sp.]